VKRRDANAILIAFAAVSGAVVAYSLPLRLYEVVLSASGVSEMIPAAAPPLGTTADISIMVAAAILCAMLAALLLPASKSGEAGRKKRNFMTFAFSKLAFLTRRAGFRKGPLSLEDNSPVFEMDAAPSVRRSDAHPDAPPRPPVFASRDLGGEALPRAGYREEFADDMPEPMVQDITGLSMPRAPEPLPWDAIEQEMSRLLANTRSTAHANPSDDDNREMPSIQELVDRLERGIAARRSHSQPYSEPDVPIGPTIASAMDFPHQADNDPALAADSPERLPEGLEEALAALRNITARER
tara:strand:- start:91769 stop:92662 length:894 start_codon:yes stop_codon:yes gene_type:complete